MKRTYSFAGIRRRRAALAAMLSGVAVTAAAFFATNQASAEPAACLSPDPAAWPSPSKPYFMIGFDTSGSMTGTIPTANSCGYPNTRIGHGKCALKNMFSAFGGQVNFGLMTFARGTATGCSAGCGLDGSGSDISGANGGTCHWVSYPGGATPVGGCGTEPTSMPNSEDRHGGEILVPMQIDNFYAPPLDPTNIPELLQWVDNDCSQSGSLSRELWADGNTPLNGLLRDAYRYLSNSWTSLAVGSSPIFSPIADSGERACRSINLILITDGDESCDADPADPVDAAADLFAGFTKGGIPWKVKTHVIAFGGGTLSKVNQIAAAGGTTQAVSASNETALSTALANIIANAIRPETCDNADNNCNGCTDEGFTHYCNQQQTCCAWSTTPQRDTCLTNYKATITAANPTGDLTLLPCTTPAQQADPVAWLCYNPKESCDNIDNNCQAGIDEGVTKCGNPAHCPKVETCNAADDDCDGQVDEGGVCVQPCVPSDEICDGCDNDCDGIADNGAPDIPCGLLAPPNCVGTRTCKPSQPVMFPGACAAMNGGPNACTNSPQTEVCDGADNDCDGAVDEGAPATPCVPVGTPANLDYGPKSQCKKGSQPCGGTCQGFVGPSAEVCDGIDNDCDGVVDDNPFGVNVACGVNQLPCKTGTTACVNGALVCQGGVLPGAEVCDGVDNDCDGSIDETPLADAPAAGQNGCWSLPGNCCTFGNLNWCPPSGGTCNGTGTLMAPCNEGKLVCQGLQKWVCSNSIAPNGEVCNGLDDNCNGMIDDGNLPQVGGPCGVATGECSQGTLACAAGVLDCMGDVGPISEICDGKDNDCDGVNDNGIVSGGPCVRPYDTTMFPGDRSSAPCMPGELLCNGAAGIECLGGVAPQAEICDGIDNDCDGTVDESGSAPDGVDGSMNPLPPPAANIGDACGDDTGECKKGAYACVSGGFVCTGETKPVLEACDCLDNDCNGQVDNTNGGVPLCSANKDCVKSSSGVCQCAPTCNPGSEYPCPPGQQCQTVTDTNTGQNLGFHCVLEPCTECEKKTVKDANGAFICAPADTPADANCMKPPVCVCRGQVGCKDPCDGVSCSAGQVCTNYGPNAGKCVVDNCYNVPCVGCNKACHLGSCLDNPCKADSCPPDQVCKPNLEAGTFACVASCSGVTCPSGQVCKEGACVPACVPGCAPDQICDTTQSPPACVTNECSGGCAGGGCCNPLTGQCGDCPCEGVICPDGQTCINECPPGQPCNLGGCGDMGAGGAGGGGGSSSSSSSSSSTSGASSSSGGVGGAGGDQGGVFGLPTGGGGCSCTTASDDSSKAGWLALLGLPLILVRRRRAARKEVA